MTSYQYLIEDYVFPFSCLSNLELSHINLNFDLNHRKFSLNHIVENNLMLVDGNDDEDSINELGCNYYKNKSEYITIEEIPKL